MGPQVFPGTHEPGPVAFRRRRVHESYEIGSIPTPAPEAAEGREREFHLLARSGAAASRRPPASPSPRPAARGPGCARRRRRRTGRERSRPTPASRAVRAARPRCPRPPAATCAPPPPPRGRCARPCAVPRDLPPCGSSRTSKRGPVSSRTGEVPVVAHPSSRVYHRAHASVPGDERGGGTRIAMSDEPPDASRSYAPFMIDRPVCPRWGRAGALDGTKLFARSGGNGGAPHGLSVSAGKTSLVGRGDTRAKASHVRHRRTGERAICLACGNIVSHHRVGAVVGVRGGGSARQQGRVSAVEMSGPRLRD